MTGPAPDTAVSTVLAIARDVLIAPELAADDDLVAHGAGSLPLLRIVATAARSLDVDIDPRTVDGPLTARSLAGAAVTGPATTAAEHTGRSR